MSHNNDPSPDDLQFALQEVRTLLLQQILATETGLLSVAELVYRNRGEDDIGEENIRYHLREMEDREIVEKEKVPSGQRVRDLPNTFFTVTDYGEAILEQANLLAESDIWAQMYEKMERTEKIERIEDLKRQDWNQDAQTEPDETASIQSVATTRASFSANDAVVLDLDDFPTARANGELSSTIDPALFSPDALPTDRSTV